MYINFVDFSSAYCGTNQLLIHNLALVVCTHFEIRFLRFLSNWNHPNRITETQDIS